MNGLSLTPGKGGIRNESARSFYLIHHVEGFLGLERADAVDETAATSQA